MILFSHYDILETAALRYNNHEVIFMTTAQLLKNLQTPDHTVDVVLDTDAYNEIDDQFAISYMLLSPEKLNVKGLCAAPFFNSNSTSPADGMIRSFDEIIKLLKLAQREDLIPHVYKGSDCYLPDEKTPVPSDSATYMAELANQYTADNPLYIVAIGAITNVASALLLNPEMKDKTVVVWLGGHAHHWKNTREFNMFQDVAAARVVFGSGVPLVQLPCCGVVDRFAASRWELEYWLKGKNPLADYLAQNTIDAAESYAAGKPWVRVIWDVTAVAWLLNDNHRFMEDELRHTPIPQYDDHYSFDNNRQLMTYVSNIHRDALFKDLFDKLTK